jgi:hypothetical protein
MAVSHPSSQAPLQITSKINTSQMPVKEKNEKGKLFLYLLFITRKYTSLRALVLVAWCMGSCGLIVARLQSLFSRRSFVRFLILHLLLRNGRISFEINKETQLKTEGPFHCDLRRLVTGNLMKKMNEVSSSRLH